MTVRAGACKITIMMSQNDLVFRVLNGSPCTMHDVSPRPHLKTALDVRNGSQIKIKCLTLTRPPRLSNGPTSVLISNNLLTIFP